ncbi:hypothetical protein LPJ61_001359 [Coemansia biformis]|uniref:Uncharacterized protein n=1 Tax=Coemansia biformis TaxID=1286918 RepID=A0A9W7YH25_9FUNG|nr:hypothetical protein LPJ61_001359 [Coemansia biformis]
MPSRSTFGHQAYFNDEPMKKFAIEAEETIIQAVINKFPILHDKVCGFGLFGLSTRIRIYENGLEWRKYDVDTNNYSLGSEDPLLFNELIFSVMMSTNNVKVTNGDGMVVYSC